MTEDNKTGKPGRGRPKKEGIDTKILEAAIRVLAAEGLEGFSVAKVAAEVSTAKATVYSRFPTRMALIGAALTHLRIDNVPEPTDDVRSDLVELLEHMTADYERIGGLSLTGSCLATEKRTPELLETIRMSTFLPRRESFLRVLRAGQANGQIREDADLEQAVSAAVGAYYADHLAGRPTNGGWAARVADSVLRGIAVPDSSGTRPSGASRSTR
ncbi:TetR/AcrR family transcriptional regulator [Streptomyces sp. NPDC005483]|uniref:TetR/AcrR family transcriptional regulator n=1 Tax=Streptomyces sp. NPDC005483 TaxID=3154882 RepID=UPI0033B698EC